MHTLGEILMVVERGLETTVVVTKTAKLSNGSTIVSFVQWEFCTLNTSLFCCP